SHRTTPGDSRRGKRSADDRGTQGRDRDLHDRREPAAAVLRDRRNQAGRGHPRRPRPRRRRGRNIRRRECGRHPHDGVRQLGRHAETSDGESLGRPGAAGQRGGRSALRAAHAPRPAARRRGPIALTDRTGPRRGHRRRHRRQRRPRGDRPRLGDDRRRLRCGHRRIPDDRSQADDGVERPPPLPSLRLPIRLARAPRPAPGRRQERAHRTVGAGPHQEDGAPPRGSQGVGVSKSRMETRVERDEDAKHEPVENKPPIRPDLKILESQVLRGPNFWSYDPAIRLLVDLGSLEHWPSNTVPAFNGALIDLLPGLHDHGCSIHRPGGFIERLRDGTWMGHVAEHVALEFQRETGGTMTRGKTRRAGTPGTYNVVYGYNEEQGGLAAGKSAGRLINPLVQANPPFDFIAELESLVLLADQAAFGPSTQAILDEAARRDIPYIRLNEQSFVQLGQGKYQQRIRATMTSRTSALGVDIAGDKKLTTSLLASAGLPVPRSQMVESADEAAAAAVRIGYPVVTKPLDGNHGRGVSLELRTEEDVRRGFERALRQTRSRMVVVESFIQGND